MTCPIHQLPMQGVCGDLRCGLCYEAWLLSAPDRNREPRTGSSELTIQHFVGYGQKEKKT